jgi:hypothetical protein
MNTTLRLIALASLCGSAQAQVQISSITDAFAKAPGTIQIQGGVFSAPLTVTFDGVPQAANLVNPGLIDVTLAGPTAPGVFDVAVQTPAGTGSLENGLAL